MNFLFLNQMMILRDICLKPFNTFSVRVKAKHMVSVNSVLVLSQLKELYDLQSADVLILGEGSNVLFVNHFKGLILLDQIRGIEIVSENDKDVFVKVGGGENWSAVVDFVVSKNWGGIENLSLIPGTAGAAPVQNIGAYGTELKDVFFSLNAFDMATGDQRKFEFDDCKFSYRNSVFKTDFSGRYFITDITLKLRKHPFANLQYAPLKKAFSGRNPETVSIAEVSAEVKKIRRTKLPDPKVLGNAGSFFKNPIVSSKQVNELKEKYPDIPTFYVSENESKVAAGWLIEQCGWKGKRIGDAGVHDKQALVLVNYGNASGREIFDLSLQISESVLKTFGIELEREVRII